jgi:hypothetical protein
MLITVGGWAAGIPLHRQDGILGYVWSRDISLKE